LVVRPPSARHSRRIERKSHEANVSAESNPPRTHARVPRENEHQGWQAGIGPQASEGPTSTRAQVQQEEVAVVDATGELRGSLRRADFVRGTHSGRRLAGRYFLVFVHDRADGGGVRLGITVTRKVGKAVRRNRIKRRVREWVRSSRVELGSCDLIVIAKRGIPERLSQQEVQADLDGVIASITPSGRSS
jgi:ribonuclease P protein component